MRSQRRRYDRLTPDGLLMLGYNHAGSGLGLGLATIPLLGATTPAVQASWVVGLGGAALLVDLDTPTSTASRMWGPLSTWAGRAIGALTGGHRQGTHDLLLTPLALYGLGTLTAGNDLTMAIVLTVLIGLALSGLSMSTGTTLGALTNLALSAIGTWWLMTSGATTLEHLPLLLALGAVVHIAGDALTTEGVPIPLLWLAGNHKRLTLGLFRTGHLIEKAVIGPALTLLTLGLLAHHTNITELATTYLAWTTHKESSHWAYMIFAEVFGNPPPDLH